MRSNKKTNENKIPCQAVENKLKIISDVPQELKSLNKLQIALISQWLLFKKQLLWQKKQMLKIRGAICDIPLDLWGLCKYLPRNSVFWNNPKKNFKKLAFNSHVYFKPVCTQKVLRCPFLLEK